MLLLTLKIFVPIIDLLNNSTSFWNINLSSNRKMENSSKLLNMIRINVEFHGNQRGCLSHSFVFFTYEDAIN